MKKFKNLSKSLAVGVTAIALMLSCASCHKKDNDSITLKFDKSNVEMAVGATTDVTVSKGVSPYTAVSSDIKVATTKVNASVITITGVAKGVSTISVTDKNNNKGNFSVTVK